MESIAPPSTRELRGLALYREHGAEIIHEGRGVYTVPGCPDYQRHKQPCKHVYAATIYRSKARAKARREQAARTTARASRASLTRKPHASGELVRASARALAVGVAFALPSFFLLYVLPG